MLKMFVVRDSKSESYAPPFCMRTRGEAVRAWETSCNDGESMMSKYPTDFSLLEIGEFDELTGSVTLHGKMNLIGVALDFKRKPEAELPLAPVRVPAPVEA